MQRHHFKLSEEFQEIHLAHSVAVHALREYRQWRDNDYIGHYLGAVRTDYLGILRGRVKDAIDAYRLIRDSVQSAYRHAS